MGAALIVDNDKETLLTLSEIFRGEGFTTEVSESLTDARGALMRKMPDVAVIRESLAGGDSLRLIEELDLSSVMEMYLISDDRSLDTATRAMRLGVTDYLQLPINRNHLIENLRDLTMEISCKPEDAQVAKDGRGMLVGESQPMRKLYRAVRKCAPSDATVFLTGESGAGKELVAQTIHQLSSRSSCDCIALNCSALPRELMESELFGHKKGSFTGAMRNHKGYFERAAGGTLFLDEITELDPALQAKLLRVLDAGEVNPVGSETGVTIDVRIIAATNREAKKAVESGHLREDLYFRLAQFPIRVPPLRDRGDDIDLLSDHFLAQQNAQHSMKKHLCDETREALHLHDWPGNVRELKNAILHGHLVAGEAILPKDLPEDIPSTAPGREKQDSQVGLPMAEVERLHLLKTLAHFEGNKNRCADALGISLKTLYNRLQKYESRAR